MKDPTPEVLSLVDGQLRRLLGTAGFAAAEATRNDPLVAWAWNQVRLVMIEKAMKCAEVQDLKQQLVEEREIGLRIQAINDRAINDSGCRDLAYTHTLGCAETTVSRVIRELVKQRDAAQRAANDRESEVAALNQSLTETSARAAQRLETIHMLEESEKSLSKRAQELAERMGELVNERDALQHELERQQNPILATADSRPFVPCPSCKPFGNGMIALCDAHASLGSPAGHHVHRFGDEDLARRERYCYCGVVLDHHGVIRMKAKRGPQEPTRSSQPTEVA